MPILNIFSLDDIDFKDTIISLSNGSHIIGRGELLNITDKRVSRKHAQIDVANDSVTLISTHQNPCFIRASQSTNLTILKQNDHHELNSGDQFGLMPDNYWFKVKINNTNVQENEPENTNGKRYLENNTEPDTYSKKIKVESDSDIDQEHTKSKVIRDLKLEPIELISDNIKDVTKCIDVPSNTDTNRYIERSSEPTLHTSPNKIKIENDVQCCSASGDVQAEPGLVLKEEIIQDIKLETVGTILDNDKQTVRIGHCDSTNLNVSTEEAAADSSNQQKVREKCWYGERCYRKNPEHKQLYSHPGDDDYVSNTHDNVPDCPYGASCYRKNIAHQQKYRHTTKISLQQTQRKRKPKPPSDPSNQTPEDDYDYDDPFINDGSSDDFEPSDYEDSDSNWEDSQEMSEELKERKRLLKEAKKFTESH